MGKWLLSVKDSGRLMADSLYQMKQGVVISRFDDGNTAERTAASYLINYEERYWRVSEIVYRIFMCMENAKTVPAIQEYLAKEYSIYLSEDKVKQVIDTAFVKNGLLEGTQADSVRKQNKLIWGRFTIFKPAFILKFKALKIFFSKKCLVFGSASILLWMLYILSTSSNGAVINELVSMRFTDVIVCYLFVIVAGFCHEYGHSVAAMSYGGKPGRIGVGIYMIMPVMFSDVTDVWRLDRRKRVIVDLGGIYFQGLFLLLCFAVNQLFVHNHILNIGILLSGFQILSNLNPFIKLDGYWVLADYLGVSEIKEVVIQTWKGLLFRKNKGNSDNGLPLDKRIIIYVYTLLTGCFFVYFIKILAGSLILALTKFHGDIIALYDMLIKGQAITISNVFHYLADRISSFIVLIFFIRLLYGLLRNIIRSIRGVKKQQC